MAGDCETLCGGRRVPEASRARVTGPRDALGRPGSRGHLAVVCLALVVADAPTP